MRERARVGAPYFPGDNSKRHWTRVISRSEEFEPTSTYAMFQNALLTVAAHREEVWGRPPTSTSSYALTYGAAETSSSSQLSSSGSTSGRSLSSGHKDTLKEAIRPVMKASSKHSFSQNLVEQAVSVTSTEFAVLKDLEAVGVEESIRNWAAVGRRLCKSC